MISKTNPDLWERKSGGGCLAMMGLPFLAFTAITTLNYLGLIHNERISNSPNMALVVSLICLFIGLSLFFVRHGFTLNRKTRQAREWISVLMPLRTTTYDLDDYDHIKLTVKNRKFQSTETIALSITIESESSDATPIFIEESAVHEKSRTVAKELSEFLNLPIKE